MWHPLLALFCTALVVARAGADFVTYDALSGHPYSVSYDERAFTINGTRTLLLGGSFHPPRIAYGDWEALLAEAKADGLNHVQVYVFWNFHERTRGEYNFAANTRADLAGFFEMAGRAGLFVNVRIGPYVCAEWNGGGFPLWLKHVENFTCSRCADPIWEAEMKRFVVKVANVMRPYLAREGGPIIMAQIENELHSSPDDPYVMWCGELAAELELDIPWVMCNGASAPNTVNTCNGNTCGKDGGYADTHATLFPGQPLGWTEDWSWFTTWGGTVTDHPASYMAQNIAEWFAKGGSHHNYYMWYGGNHIESWAASGLTNQYGDGSNMYSDTLPNEPKKSHLAAMHVALAKMNDALLSDEIQTRSSAVAVVSCPVDPENPGPAGHAWGKDVCVDGHNGTGVVMCDPADESQHWDFDGTVGASGLLMHIPARNASKALCISGACDTLNVTGRVEANGCVPLPLLPCNSSDKSQLWTSLPGDDPLYPSYLRNAANGGCLAGWGKSANPGDPNSQPIVGVHNCSTGWGSGTFKWTPNATTGLIENVGIDGPHPKGGISCLSARHPALSPVLAFEYDSSNGTASFVQNNGPDTNVTWNGVDLVLPAGSISFVLDGEELFNTDTIATAGIKCNRSYTPVALSGWMQWAEPLPPSGGNFIRSLTPLEQLSLTNDHTDYMFYSRRLQQVTEPWAVSDSTIPHQKTTETQDGSGWGATATMNLTISSIESNAFLLFLDGVFIGSTNDHTKGPDHVTLSIPVPVTTASKAKDLLLVSVALGIQNFHGTNPLLFQKGIIGSVTLGATNLTDSGSRDGWVHRPFLTGQLQHIADGGSDSNSTDVMWAKLSTPLATKTRPLTWLKASFKRVPDKAANHGVLKLDALGLSRGHFYVNGHDLGRYYTITAGQDPESSELTQRYYYIPGDVLVPGDNTLVIIDEVGVTALPRLVLAALELPSSPSGCQA